MLGSRGLGPPRGRSGRVHPRLWVVVGGGSGLPCVCSGGWLLCVPGSPRIAVVSAMLNQTVPGVPIPNVLQSSSSFVSYLIRSLCILSIFAMDMGATSSARRAASLLRLSSALSAAPKGPWAVSGRQGLCPPRRRCGCLHLRLWVVVGWQW